MNTMQVARKLVELDGQGKNDEAFETLYADDIVSVEAFVAPDGSHEARGKAALKAKHAWWAGAHEVHSVSVTGPWPHGDRFVLGFRIDVTVKETGVRMQMDEVGLYTVKDGRIVREEFFYEADG
ncbi:MAG: nuclear transport factor 2 family protein [Burkholderiales bacterium]|nr:nuclear transport factor 2 family protein [Burkholderiales bacterium]